MLRVVTRRGAVAATLALAVVLAIALAPAADAARKRGAPKRDPLKIPNSAVELATWESVEGWAEDNHAEALGAFLTSCRTLMRHSPASRTPVQAALAEICGRAVKSLAARRCRRAGILREEFPPGADCAARREGRLLHRLLRADRRRRQIPERQVHDAALSAAVRHAGHAHPSFGEKRQSRQARGEEKRALLQSRRHRGWRDRGPRLRDCLRERDRRVLRADPGLGARAARGRLDAAAQLRRAERPSLHGGRDDS